MKTGTRIQVTSTLGQILQELTRDKARRKKRKLGKKRRKILSTKDFCLFLVIQAKIYSENHFRAKNCGPNTTWIRHDGIAATSVKTCPGKGDIGSILPGFDPRDDDIPSDPKFLILANIKVLNQKSLCYRITMISRFDVNVPLHVVKIRYRHHKSA